MKLLTPIKAVNLAINQHPSLYAAAGFELAKLRVYDHIFNVIGNGIRDTEEYCEYMRNRRKGVQTPLAKYLSGERLHYAYMEIEEFEEGDCKFSMPKSGSSLDEVFTEAEKADHPEVKKWLGFDVSSKFTPYPNFKKEYSTVWKIDTELLTEEWIDEIIWFYRKCEEFFDGPDASEYSYAVTKDPKKLERQIKEQELFFERYKKETANEAEYWAAITENWQCEYRGDTLDFLQRRWEKEHARIRAYITETVEMLNLLLQEKLRLHAKLLDN